MVGDQALRSVLLIDDDKESCLLLADLIRLLRPGATIWTAYDGEEGVTLALRHRPSAVVMDLEMPVLNGEGAAARIRSELGAKAGVLVAVSGSPQRLALPGNQTLFDHCLLKPVPIEFLMRMLGLP